MGWFARFATGRKTFVETGTFRGDGVCRALEDFDRVYSIELNPMLHAAAVLRFRGDERVTILCGDSAKVLATLEIKEPVCFYLDAHWSGRGPQTPLPLLDELRAIARRPYTDVVIVDDMRLMGKQSIDGDDLDYPKSLYDWREASFQAIAEACPGDYEWTTDIDRLVIYR